MDAHQQTHESPEPPKARSMQRLVRRFWECECCGSLIACLPQDDASRYKCPQCAIVKCSHGGLYHEITKERFFTECGLDTPNVKVSDAPGSAAPNRE